MCLALALWNGRDAIIKERMFGLTTDGNHGEDVKEYYFYLDSTPTHSFMRMVYKYPQVAYPYGNLVAKNRPVFGEIQRFQQDLQWRGLPAVPRILPRRHRSRRRREPSDRMDRPGRETPPAEWRVAINRSSLVAPS